MPRLLALTFIFLALAGWPGRAEPIDSIARIRSLPPEEAARRLPAAIEAIVSFRDPAAPALIAFDGREGIYVELPKGTNGEIATGARVRIEGVTAPGGFLPILVARQVTLLGAELLPPPRRIDPSELFSPALDCQWVEVPAIITGFEEGSGVALTAEISGWSVKLLLPADPNAGERIAEIVQRPVTVRGVVGSVFNEQRQLTGRHFFVPSFAHIVPSESGAPDDEPQLRAIDELLRSDATSRTRVRVRGVVTHDARDGLYLRGKRGSIFIRSARTEPLAPGTQVEAEGFAAVAPFRPILRATRVTPLDHGPPPEPAPLELSGSRLVSQQAELVRLEADVLGRRDGADGELALQCRAGKWFFEALLADRSGLAPQPRENDRVRLTGICELTTTGVLPFSRSADGFRLHLRSAADIAIVEHAPWWTLRRLLWALGTVGAIALLALAWAALLRRRVAAQTQVIGAQIERAATQDERQRIARELHDTIEQELAGLSAQLRNARQRLARAPEQAGAAIALAERMLRHCREEARTSIRDLRSVALEQRGLRGALEEMLAPLAYEAGVDFKLEVAGAPRSLPGPLEVHLLRIAQQAVANALQHAGAQTIEARLAYDPHSVTIEVRDDGRGFDPAAPAPRGHFGIAGIRERANKLHAALTIDSAPGSGTAVRVVIPTAPASANGDSLP